MSFVFHWHDINNTKNTVLTLSNNYICMQTNCRFCNKKQAVTFNKLPSGISQKRWPETRQILLAEIQFDLHWILSASSRVGATSSALFEWQLTRVGSAPCDNSKEQTSTRFLDVASCSGVNCQRSIALTQAPCWQQMEKKIKSMLLLINLSIDPSSIKN